tara:strand:+ start:1318 stop:1623 length:306 start_codon:yes stop_codon:yes gene_type:complete
MEDQHEQVETPIETSTERCKRFLKQARKSAEAIMEKALEDKALLEEIEVDLEELAEDMEGKETELLGGEKVEDESTDSNAHTQTRIDPDPNSPTYNQQIPM